jgi:phosphoribosylanthranilate isomerase
MMVKVKICGITNVRDARFAASAGADVLGFNFVMGTPRCMTPEQVKAIVLELPPFVARVGVFSNADHEKVAEIMDFCGLDYAQLHGLESPSYCARLEGRRLIKAIRVRSADDLHNLQRYNVEAFLLDTYVADVPGGTGMTFDWGIARQASNQNRVILAGGLTPENVADAILAARPYAVDVCSGVEEEPRKKSKELVEAFIRIAKSVDV